MTRVAGTEVVATILQLASLVQKFPYLERKVTRCPCNDQELYNCNKCTRLVILTQAQQLLHAEDDLNEQSLKISLSCHKHPLERNALKNT